MKHNRGFTFIETILYVGILSIFITGVVNYALNFITIRTKSNVAQEVNDNLRLVMDRLSYEIRNATTLNSVSATTLSVGTSETSRNPTVLSLINGQIFIKLGTGTSQPLTSDLVNISNLTFTNLSSGDTKSINISYTITANYINSSGRSEYDRTQTYAGSSELRLK